MQPHCAGAPTRSTQYPCVLHRGAELIRTGKGDDEVTSSGTIVLGFEGVFDVCYKVKLDNGMYKEAVPEEEISGAVTSDMGDLFGEW